MSRVLLPLSYRAADTSEKLELRGSCVDAGSARIISDMHFAFGDILGLGHSFGAFGYTLALILTWFVAIGALVNFLVVYIIATVLAERKENQLRIRAYDEAHSNSLG
jgi:phage shock protein PspC (stress-responsive transcriptional regulator)